MKRIASRLVVLMTALLAGNCTEGPITPEAGEPSFAISDAFHGGGNDHFAWLPPIAGSPESFNGAFDGSLSPVVAICNLSDCAANVVAEFTMTTGPGSETVRVVPEEEHYIVNWHTDESDLEEAATYRIRVLVAGTELGFADVDLVTGGNELKNVDTGDYVALKDGRTLPIQFRIEEGAVFVVGPEGGTIRAHDGVVVLEVPAGAVTGPIGITIDPVTIYPEPERFVVGTVFDFGPDGTEFVSPVHLTIQYDVNNIPPGVAENDLRMLNLIADTWIEVEGSTLDVAMKTVTGAISHFTGFGLGQPGLPAESFPSVCASPTLGYFDPRCPLVYMEECTTYLDDGTFHRKVRRPDWCEKGEDGMPRWEQRWIEEYGKVYGVSDLLLKFSDEYVEECTTPLADGTFQRKADAPMWCGEDVDEGWTEEYRKLHGLPPRSTPVVSAGDVHMRTPDGLAYDFQGAGEYLLVASDDGDVVVQVRQEPWGSSLASVNTAVAMNVSGDRVGVYVGRSPALYVNGQPTELAPGPLDLANGGRVHRLDLSSRTEYLVEWPNGFVTGAKLRSGYMDVGVSKPEGLQTLFSGLVGNLNGQAEDDMQTRDGVTLGFPVLFDELYKSFGDSWRISDAESLFDYEPGTSTETFQLLDFPLRQVSTADLDQTVVDAARQTCEAAGILDPTLLDDCILDLAVTGDPGFVESAVNAEPPAIPVGVVGVVNGGFDLNADGWLWENIDFQGGWRSAGGNPGGNFALNQAGELATDPKVCQVVEGIEMGQSFRITGDYASYAPSFGDPAKPDAFVVTVNGAVVLELPRPAPVSTDWTAFSTEVITGVENPTICFVAERDGDDSSFFVDNIALKGTGGSGSP